MEWGLRYNVEGKKGRLMTRFIVTGGKQLKGTIKISGSKNAALPAMCAALLADTPTRLTNVPDIRDVHALAEIIRSLGGFVNQIDAHTWEISGSGLKQTEISYLLGRRLRASILLLGPILARLGAIRIPHPGGCLIGNRPVDTHFEALRGMNATIEHDGDYYAASVEKLKAAYLYLDEVSVTATENVLMAAALTEGVTTIRPAAAEPHVVNLCELLIAMGATIEGVGTQTLKITGVKALQGVTHRINADEIETGTFAVAAAVTGGELRLTDAPDDLDPIISKLRLMGVAIEQDGTTVTVKAGEHVGAKIQVGFWPRFPTDLQPQFAILATQAAGESMIHEWMYENRLKYVESLVRMGAKIDLINPHQAIIHGPTPLHSATIASPDLRSGIAFVLAALTASGESTIEHAELILRGYERLVEKLTSVGAEIRQLEAEDETGEKEKAT